MAQRKKFPDKIEKKTALLQGDAKKETIWDAKSYDDNYSNHLTLH